MNLRILAITAFIGSAFLGTAYAQDVMPEKTQQQQQVQVHPAVSGPDAGSARADERPRTEPRNSATWMTLAPRSNDECVGPASFCNIYFGGS